MVTATPDLGTRVQKAERFLQAAYDAFYVSSLYQLQDTPEGLYIPNSLALGKRLGGLLVTIDKINREKHPPDRIVVDAGSGSGELVAGIALAGYRSYGIEILEQPYRVSHGILNTFSHRFGATAKVTRGNFLDDASYEALGISFAAVSWFVHSLNNRDDLKLVQRIEQESSPGTKLAILCGERLAAHLPGTYQTEAPSLHQFHRENTGFFSAQDVALCFEKR